MGCSGSTENAKKRSKTMKPVTKSVAKSKKPTGDGFPTSTTLQPQLLDSDQDLMKKKTINNMVKMATRSTMPKYPKNAKNKEDSENSQNGKKEPSLKKQVTKQMNLKRANNNFKASSEWSQSSSSENESVSDSEEENSIFEFDFAPEDICENRGKHNIFLCLIFFIPEKEKL